MLIVAGMALVLYKIANLSSKSKSFQSTDTEIPMAFSENIQTVFGCGEKVCIVTVGAADGQRLFILDPNTGKIGHTVLFKEYRPTMN